MKIIEYRGYYGGFIEGATISDVYVEFPEFFDSLHLLIARLDSSQSHNDLSQWLAYVKENFENYVILTNTVWVDQKSVGNLFRDGKTFVHFDEIYLLNNSPVKDLSVCEHFTSDSSDFSKKVPSAFLEEFKRAGAIRYLSDGCGLNFFCESRTLAEKIFSVLVH